jgi:hypothetical protein
MRNPSLPGSFEALTRVRVLWMVTDLLFARKISRLRSLSCGIPCLTGEFGAIVVRDVVTRFENVISVASTKSVVV